MRNTYFFAFRQASNLVLRCGLDLRQLWGKAALPRTAHWNLSKSLERTKAQVAKHSPLSGSSSCAAARSC